MAGVAAEVLNALGRLPHYLPHTTPKNPPPIIISLSCVSSCKDRSIQHSIWTAGCVWLSETALLWLFKTRLVNWQRNFDLGDTCGLYL